MFAIGAWIILALMLAGAARPAVLAQRWYSIAFGLGAGMMICSLLVLAWRWLP